MEAGLSFPAPLTELLRGGSWAPEWRAKKQTIIESASRWRMRQRSKVRVRRRNTLRQRDSGSLLLSVGVNHFASSSSRAFDMLRYLNHKPPPLFSSFPPSPFALSPILAGVWGYHPRENFGIQRSCRWVLEHFRHKHPLNPRLASLFLSPRISVTHFALPGMPLDVPDLNDVYTVSQ